MGDNSVVEMESREQLKDMLHASFYPKIKNG
jgi:hypothetical protein